MNNERFDLTWEDIFTQCINYDKKMYEGENGALCVYNAGLNTLTFTHVPNNFTDVECMNQLFRPYDPFMSVSKLYKKDRSEYTPPTKEEIAVENYKELSEKLTKLANTTFEKGYYTDSIDVHSANLEIIGYAAANILALKESKKSYKYAAIVFLIAFIFMIILYIFR